MRKLPILAFLKYLKRNLMFSKIRFRTLGMLALIHLRPEAAHRFSPLKCLPAEEGRIPKAPNPLDEFVFLKDCSSEMPTLESVNIVIRGASFDRNLLGELKGPTYLVNWFQKVEGENIVYATGDQIGIQMYVQKGLFPVFLAQGGVYLDADGTLRGVGFRHQIAKEVEHVFDQPENRIIRFQHLCNARQAPIGSGLGCVIALSKFANQVDIYGWDHYLTSPPEQSSYWKVLRGMLRFDGSRDQPDVVEQAIYNWHYAHRLGELDFIRNHGYLGQAGNHPKLMRKLEKVFYVPQRASTLKET